MNELGRREWVNKTNPNLVAEKAYSWVDRVLILDSCQSRLVIDDITFTEFQNQLDKWEEVK